MKTILLKKYEDTKKILKQIPVIPTSLYILSVVLMNFLASKEISIGVDWIVCDCGITISWYGFLYMDVVTRNLGAKASITISIIAIIINLGVSLLFIGISYIPGYWSQFYEFNSVDVNAALNNTLRGTCYIIFGSVIAFLTSSIINATLNQAIGKMFKKQSFIEYITRTYVSTLIAQFADNMIFALIVGHVFFGWSLFQCAICALIGCILESLCELVFSPLGFYISEKYRKNRLKTNLNVLNKKEKK